MQQASLMFLNVTGHGAILMGNELPRYNDLISILSLSIEGQQFVERKAEKLPFLSRKTEKRCVCNMERQFYVKL